MKTMGIIEYANMDLLRLAINECQDENHIQQVAFSTYHDALTQVCFTCAAVRTTIHNKVYEFVIKESVKEEALNIEGEEAMEELDLSFPDNEALADFLIQGSNEAECNAACFQEAYKRLFKK
jgi:hypothetical protein